MREKLETALSLLETVGTVIAIAVPAVRKIASVLDASK